ncbi:lysoplasmalogenase family protein [Tissierella sp. Yu-01]|uniref:lysoplasmalogenase family protein n=1 Tax=Tissierella sp. Yu-01 TaxID=3035694 RepID=UPI00240D016F|nr:lysoplasmalogenase family protein [Tissierella sp. Yu-01]WFA08949.1 hypothetical protein P3962_14685 [Tissierella sp. Yu-01]
MSKGKIKLIIFIILIIVLLSGSFITLDFARLSIIKDQFIYKHYLYIMISKFLIIILSTIIVFLIGKDGLNRKDTKRLKLIFIFIILSDISLAMGDTAFIGIIMFGVVQISLIIRNGTGIFEKLHCPNFRPFRNVQFINTILGTIFFVLIALDLFYSLTDNNNLLYLMIFYGSLLCLSLWTAVMNHILGIFPRINSLLVSIGMTFFVFCDLSVGFSLILKKGTYWIIADSLNWIFYTPAVLLIALSGYNFNK